MDRSAKKHGVALAVNQVESVLSPFFVPTEVTRFTDAKGSDLQRYARYFAGMLHHGVALAPAQFEAMFLSAAMTEEELRQVLETFQNYLKQSQS